MNIQLIRFSRRLHRKTALFHRNSLNIKTFECFRYNETAATSVDEVVIPQRIERGPTDILEALASTVSRDFTAPHYKFHDDPFLIPRNNLDARSYSLSKESGRKAARYFLDNYPDLFFRDAAEPKIAAFSFKELYDENTDVNEDDLNDRIRENDVANSIIAYNNLKAKGVKLENDTLQNLLEMVCFFNSSEPQTDEDFREEVWYEEKQNSDMVRRQWKDSDFAEKLFNEMEEKNVSTYVTLMLGYTKYFQSQKAFQLREQMIAENIPLTLNAYNGLIENIVGVKESGESRWELITNLLQEMNSNKVRPNVNTFNACLFVLSHCSTWNKSPHFAKQLIAEMKRLKIRPSLASYYFLLQILMRRKKEELGVLHEIIGELEGKPFILRHKNDANFLEMAMHVCCNFLSDLELGYRIHNLLSIGNNHKFFEGAKSESTYYRHFFHLLCLCETSDNLFNVYNKYVPNVYNPEVSVVLEIIKNIELHEAYGHVPQLYSDIVSSHGLWRANTVHSLLKCLSGKKLEDSSLQKQFVEIAWNIFQALVERSKQENVVPIPITSEMCNDLLNVFNNGEHTEHATSLIKYIEQSAADVTPSANIITEYCRLSAKKNQIDNVVNCVAFASYLGLQEVVDDLVNNRKDYGLNDELLQAMKLIEAKDEEEMEKNEKSKSIRNELESSSSSSSNSSSSSSESSESEDEK